MVNMAITLEKCAQLGKSLIEVVIFFQHCGDFQFEKFKYKPDYKHVTCYKFECSHWWKIHLKKILYKIYSPV